jgi:recombination protein RecT
MNQSTNAPQKPKFTVAINTPGFQRLINNTLGDPERAKRLHEKRACSVCA